MSIDKELLDFASGRASWLRDCLRRICTQSELTPNDFQEVFTNLKATEGLAPAGVIQHLDPSHLVDHTVVARASTVLTSISDVKNANRLASNQTLLFAEQGITLIYGYNGSGKTGYGRILKQVCRSRHEKQDPILGDVYSSEASPAASARIDCKTGGVVKTFAWTDGSPVPDELSMISVFDATTAPLYADKQNKIEFLPLGLDVLPRLGKICEQLTAEIDIQIQTVDKKLAVPLPKVESSSHIQFLSRLSVDAQASQVPTNAEIQTLFTWTASDDSALQVIQEETWKLSEPAAQSGHLARLIGTLNGFRPRLESAFTSLCPEALAEAQAKVTNAKSAREAATIAATGRFKTDPLGEAPTTGAWRRLYESAEAFSAEVYPNDEFPAIGADRVCLLCQQPIGEIAQDRFRRFTGFLRDATQKDALHAEEELAETTRTVSGIVIPEPTEIEPLFKELTDTKPVHVTLRDTIKQQCVSLTALKSELLRSLKGESRFETLPPVYPAVLVEIDSAVRILTVEKLTFDNHTKDTVALSNLKNKRTELIDRKNCAANLQIFLTRREDLFTREAWKKCREQCGTDAISRKNTQLRNSYLTQGFQQAVMNEVRNLGLDYLPLKVEGRTEHGVGYIGVALSKTGREPTSHILSEGEFRGLALACFFAEIRSIAGHDGIVVDDPVSSLDHLHVEQVAQRLVDEAKVRPQVIVFTHDLAFYYELWMTAAEANIPVHRNWIRKDGTKGFGYITSNDGPWQVKKTKERLAVLDQMIKDMPDQFTTSPDEYLKRTEAFYSKLRETWERLVEECLLNDVVGRFQPGVATQSLKGVSVTDEDYRKVFFAMKKASEFSGHDRPVGRPPVPRSQDEMKNDWGELWAYEKDLKKRADDLSSHRKFLETPPAAAVTSPVQASASQVAPYK